MAEKLTDTPDANPNPVMHIDRTGIIRYHNKASDPILKAWDLTLDSRLTGDWMELINNVLTDAAPYRQECECGSRFFMLNFVPLVDLSYVCIFGTDITEEKVAKSEMESLSRFPSENPNPVLRISEDGRIIYANDGSLPLSKFWDCDVGQLLPDPWLGLGVEAYKMDQQKEVEIDIGVQVYLMMFAPVQESGYTCLYGRDITQLKKTERELSKSIKEIAKLKDKLNAENTYLQEEIKHHHNSIEIISESDRFDSVLLKIKQVAQTNASVLIFGETGTGKELVARAVHNASRRRDRPLVKVNCAALPENLIESELFGHDKGAFTGAFQNKMGRFELADTGTIFLDEIGELPLNSQVKLLRVLQEGEFERLGNLKTISVDVRVIAATNRNLEEMVGRKEFREDLYYRLNVFPIETPPLRSRKEDIPVLVKHFVETIGLKTGKAIKRIPESAIKRLSSYHWPGNVRELMNVIERAIILSNDGILEVDEQLSSRRDNQSRFEGTLKEVERRMITTALDECNWTVEGPSGAAKRLDIPPSTLRARVKEYGITKS